MIPLYCEKFSKSKPTFRNNTLAHPSCMLRLFILTLFSSVETLTLLENPLS